VWSLGALAQQVGKVWRIGILEPFHPAVRSKLIEAFRDGLRQLGYEEGRNIVLEARFAEGKLERLPELAAELVRINVDVIVANSTQAIRAAQRATQTIPIVMSAVGDPIEAGFVASFALPGSNITGVTIFAPELMAKRMQLLKEVVPTIARVAVIWDPTIPHEIHGFKEVKDASASLKVSVFSVEVKDVDGFQSGFDLIARDRPNALLVFENAVNNNYGNRIASFSLQHRLPSMGTRALAESGGLMAYATPVKDNYKRAASYVDRIFKGAKPANLPVEQPTKFELVINLKTAKALGLEVPPLLIAQADELIE
jgi:ABC-type uncharacterized transport system substrate-binding protein